MIKARYNIYAYMSFIFVLVFLTVSVFLISHPDLNLKGKNGHPFPAPLVGFIILIFTFLLFFVLAKVVHVITIDTNSINIKGVFKKRIIERSEIKLIDLFSREDFYWSAGSVTIGTRIELEDGGKIIIADPFYSNIDRIKQTLSENFKEKIKPFNVKKSVNVTQTAFEDNLEKFAGNPFTSFNGVLFIGLVLMFGLMIINNQSKLKPAHLFLIVPIIIFYLALGSQLNYFLISNKRLIVKNHFLFWINKSYNIDDIIEVDLESPHKRSDALRITTNDFKSRLYSAGSLRRKHWNALKEKIKSLGIYFPES